jgi:DNA repair exonuclease SbcCD ATPase subunit
MELKPNTCINTSTSFSNLHGNYRHDEDTQNSEFLTFESSEGEELTSQLQRMEDELHSLRKKYMHDTKHLTSSVHKLKAQLQTAQQEQTRLASALEEQAQTHKVQLQQIQAHHERKLQRHNKDLQTLLQPNSDAVALEEEITRLRIEHEEELQIKDEEIERLQRLDKELQIQQARFDAQLREQQKQHFEQLTAAKRERAVKRIHNGEAETQAKVSAQEQVILEQALTIQGLRQQLQSTMRRRTSKPSSCKTSELDLDGELKDLISQIK